MATLGSLVIQLQADLARLNSDMNKAVGIVDGAMASIRNAAGIAKSALGGLAVGLVGGLGAGALTSSIKAVVDYGDRLNDLSKATGASVEQLSFLDFAAKQSGSSLEGLVSGIGRLQKNIGQLAAGGGSKEAAEALNALGLSAQQLARGDLVTQLATIGEALNRIQNPSERAAAAQSLFGRSARDLIPLLSEGGAGIKAMADRFVELGGVVTKGQAEAFDRLNDSLVEFNTASQAIVRNIAGGLAGTLTGFFQSIANAPQTISDSLTKITTLFGVWVQEIKIKLAEADIATAQGLQGLIPGDFGDSRLNARISEAEGRLRTAREALRKNQELLDYERGAGGGGAALLGSAGAFNDVTQGSNEEQQKAAEKLASAQQSYVDGLRKQLALQDQTTNLAKVQADIAFGSAKEFDETTRRTALALAEQLDLKKQQAEADKQALALQEAMLDAKEQEAEIEVKAQQQLVARRQSIIDNLQTPLEKYVETVKELTSPELGLGQDTIQRGVAAARAELETAQDKATGLKDVAQELGLTFSSAFEDAIIAGKNFSSILQGIAQDIARLFIRETVTEPLVGALSGALSGGLGGLFNFGGGGGGGFSNPGALFGNATGGLYRVGGSGSEHPVAFTARAGEYVAVGTRMAGGGGGEAPVVNVYNQTGADVSARRAADGRTLEVFVTSAVERNISRGGSRLGKPPIATR